jgi:hypothetical protein
MAGEKANLLEVKTGHAGLGPLHRVVAKGSCSFAGAALIPPSLSPVDRLRAVDIARGQPLLLPTGRIVLTL